MRDDGTAVTAMLGLPGLLLLAVSSHDEELEYAVETTETVTGCPDCGVVARLHELRPSQSQRFAASREPAPSVVGLGGGLNQLISPLGLWVVKAASAATNRIGRPRAAFCGADQFPSVTIQHVAPGIT